MTTDLPQNGRLQLDDLDALIEQLETQFDDTRLLTPSGRRITTSSCTNCECCTCTCPCGG
ncbi:hypothetical protein [Streptomyces violascens]|uniref:hypothetical protein n=1 Tax=Streptomyces violascens TaxID=67381 RepID=UPI0036CF8869